MYFETIREQPAPPPIKGVKIELNIIEADLLYRILCGWVYPYGDNNRTEKLKAQLIENLEGALKGRT